MSKVVTDNSYFYDKVILRLNHLPGKGKIKVLDAFSSDGKIWDEVKEKTDKEIQVLRLDKEKKQGIYLKGDNVKFLKGMDLSKFDVIDLDAYGVPFKQLKIIFMQNEKKKLDVIVFVTFIQTMFGALPRAFLKECGYPNKMVRKIPTLFNKNGMDKMKLYLALNGVSKIHYKGIKNKNYFSFEL